MRLLTLKRQLLLFLFVVINSLSFGSPRISHLGLLHSSDQIDIRSDYVESFSYQSNDRFENQKISYSRIDFLNCSNEVFSSLMRRTNDSTNLNVLKSSNSKFFFEVKSFRNQPTIKNLKKQDYDE